MPAIPNSGQRLAISRADLKLLLLLLIVVGLPWAIATAFIVFGQSQPGLAQIDLSAGIFLFCSAVYVVLYRPRGAGWFGVPVLLTVEAILEFIMIPLSRFISGQETLKPSHVLSMWLVLAGFLAFWSVSLSLRRPVRSRFIPLTSRPTRRVEVVALVLAIIGISARFLLWRSGLYSFMGDADLRNSSLGFIQWANFLGGFLFYAMIISGIEVIAKNAKGVFILLLFWGTIAATLAFGLISGMKGEVIIPLVTLLALYGISKQRLPKAALAIIIVPIIIYPFSNAYRRNLAEGYRETANTPEGLELLLTKSFHDVIDFSSSSADIGDQGASETSSRLSLLNYVSDVISLPDPSLLDGGESVWLAPVYPFIPRFLWPDKPRISDKGIRLSLALGGRADTNNALTPIGDLYSMYGLPGVILGMAVMGFYLQLSVNFILRSTISERTLFIYISLLMGLVSFETGIVVQIASAIQNILLMTLTSFAIYGFADLWQRKRPAQASFSPAHV